MSATRRFGPGVVAELAPPALRGRYSALFGLTFGVAALVGPLIGTLLLGPDYSAWPWIACGGMSVLAAATFLALGPALGRRRVIDSRAQRP
jgi:MFS family permease